jgi:transcriptional regulator with XRE-family HTH domain
MIKMKVGTRLFVAREDRKLTQAEMADLLNLTPATYSRLERNETSIDLDQVVQFAKKLDIPVQEFLPETITINSNNQQGHIGLVFGNVYSYITPDAANQSLTQKLQQKDEEIAFLREKIAFLEERLNRLEEK